MTRRTAQPTRLRQLSRQWIVAIFFIAAYAIFNWARAQNTLENTVPSSPAAQATATADLDAGERAERSRIQQARERANQEHDAAKVECYQRFAVNQCLIEARDTRNAQLADLKRQEVSLNDAQRKRRGAEQVQRTLERTSPERQEQLAQQRGRALADDAKRQQRHSERLAPTPQNLESKTREPKPRTGAAPKPSSTNAAVAPRPSSTNAAASKQARAQQKAAAQQSRLEAAAQAKARTAEREKQAAEHRADVLKRQASNKKPPAAPLPIPSGIN